MVITTKSGQISHFWAQNIVQNSVFSYFFATSLEECLHFVDSHIPGGISAKNAHFSHFWTTIFRQNIVIFDRESPYWRPFWGKIDFGLPGPPKMDHTVGIHSRNLIDFWSIFGPKSGPKCQNIVVERVDFKFLRIIPTIKNRIEN